MKTRIVWNGQGGELDSRTVDGDNEADIKKALLDMLKDGIVCVGDSFEITRIND